MDAPSMIMVMLRDFGTDALRSGFIINDGQGDIGIQPQGPMLFRQTVVFKHCATIVEPGDMHRFVVITSLIPSINRGTLEFPISRVGSASDSGDQ